jgi:hypothetical protein
MKEKLRFLPIRRDFPITERMKLQFRVGLTYIFDTLLPFSASLSLEDKLQRKLRGPRATDLVERSKTAIGAAAPQALRQCSLRKPEVRIRQLVGACVCAWISKVGVIENIEELGVSGPFATNLPLLAKPGSRNPGP